MVDRLLNLDEILKDGHSAFLFGPRGVGKTYLCKQWLASLKNVLYIDLLLHDNYLRYISDTKLFRREVEQNIAEKRLIVFIDEVQKYPPILDEVHYLIENYKDRVQFLLTGSSARKLKRGRANLLAGRAWTLRLHPFTHLEGSFDLDRALQLGTLPEIALDQKHAKRTLSAYVETYIKEEVLQEGLIRKLAGFIRFLDIAGQMNGEPVNYTKIAKECKVSSHTVQEYYTILVDTLLAFRIDSWGHSPRKQILQASKYYLFDNGILNALRRELEMQSNPNSYRYGKLFETFVIQEIIRLNDYTEKTWRLSYWRTSSDLEVDIILSQNAYEPPLAIEIKSKSKLAKKDIRALKAFALDQPTARLICLCTSPRAYRMDNVEILPWQQGLKQIFST